MTKRKLLIIQLLSAELKKCTGRDWLVHYEEDDIIVSSAVELFGDIVEMD